MKVQLSETVTRTIIVEMSDEIDIEKVIDGANAVRGQCDSAKEALSRVLESYKQKNPNAFDYEIQADEAWDKVESPIGFEYEI